VVKTEGQGGRLLGLLLFGLLVSLVYGRLPLALQEAPAVSVEYSNLLISLGKGFDEQGVHQFSDASAEISVIKLTDSVEGRELLRNSLKQTPIQNGELFNLTGKGSQKRRVIRGWMPAGQRMALGVALHPDRMNEQDWEALPGIGPGLSHRIEMNRQKYGEFRNLDGLQRVSGVGTVLVKNISQYFLSPKLLKNKKKKI